MRCITLLLVSPKISSSDGEGDGGGGLPPRTATPPAVAASAASTRGARRFYHECVQIRVDDEEMMGQFRFRAIGFSEGAGKRARGARRPSTVARESVLINASSGTILEHQSDNQSVVKHLSQGDVVICFVFSSDTSDAEKVVPSTLDLRSWISVAGPLYKLTQHGRFLNLTRRWHMRQFMLRDLWIHKVHSWNDGDGASPRNYSGLAAISPQRSSRLIGESPTKKTKMKTPSPARQAGSIELDAPLILAKLEVLDADSVRKISAYRAPSKIVGGFKLSFPRDLAGGGLDRDGSFGRELQLCSDDEESFSLWEKAVAFVVDFSENSRAEMLHKKLVGACEAIIAQRTEKIEIAPQMTQNGGNKAGLEEARKLREALDEARKLKEALDDAHKLEASVKERIASANAAMVDSENARTAAEAKARNAESVSRELEMRIKNAEEKLAEAISDRDAEKVRAYGLQEACKQLETKLDSETSSVVSLRSSLTSCKQQLKELAKTSEIHQETLDALSTAREELASLRAKAKTKAG